MTTDKLMSRRNITVLALLIVSLACIAAMFTFEKNAIILGLSGGILGSILANFITAIVQSNLIQQSGQNPSSLQEAIPLLNSILKGSQSLGLQAISGRDAYDDRFWEENIKQAAISATKGSELILVGRSLERWAKEPTGQVCAEALVRFVRNGGKVLILTLKPDGELARLQLGIVAKDLNVSANRFSAFLTRRVFTQLKDADRLRIEHRWADRVPLTFTMFSGNQFVWVSPYMSVADTSKNIAFVLSAQSEAANAIINDFRLIWSHSAAANHEIAQMRAGG